MSDERVVPPSEAAERPWASNDKMLFDMLLKHFDEISANMKVQMDNLISHEKAMFAHSERLTDYSELGLKQSIEFQQKSNDDYLVAAKQLRDEYMKHSADRDAHSLENNRYTLDRLYSVFPEEAIGLSTLVTLVIEALKKEGIIPAQK